MRLDDPALAALIAAEGSVVRVVVARAAGSAPREAGVAMVVRAAGQAGTIGGGTLEHRATEVARGMLAGGPAVRREVWPLGPALGQCCGGAVTLWWERLAAVPALPHARSVAGGPMPPAVAARLDRSRPGTPPEEVAGWLIEGAEAAPQPVWIWGAGHVGRAIAAVVAPLPGLTVTLIDTASDRLPDPLPPGVTPVVAADMPRLVPHAPQDGQHLIVTHSHDIDLALCDALLRRGFASCGLIGSATKKARFRARLHAMGHDDARISRIACPIGDPGLGKHPQAIAVGVAAALLTGGMAAAREGDRAG